ncbi:MAG: NAD-dependent epimerase/dehydratase family protein [Candidatus Hodarchaeales archaeon]
MKWLLMGGSGFVGNYLIDELGRNYPNSEISVADIQECRINGIDYYKCDFRIPEQIYGVLREINPDYIINLAGIFKSDDILLSVQINSMLLAHICEYYKDKPEYIRGILIMGSSAQYGPIDRDSPFPDEFSPCNPKSLYGMTKLLQETIGIEYYNQYKVPVLCVRTSNLIGPGQSDRFVIAKIIKQMLHHYDLGEKPVLRLGNINAGRDFIDVRDAVRAYVTLITNQDLSGEIFNVSSGKAISLDEVITLVKNLLSSDEINIQASHSDIPDIHALDNTKISNILHGFPRISLEDSIMDMITFIKQNTSN